MKMEIISEKENPVTGSKRIWLGMVHDGKRTPSRHEIFPEVLKALGTGEDVTLVHKIFSETGAAKSKIMVVVYREAKDLPVLLKKKNERKIKKHLEKSGGAKPAEATQAGKEAAAEKAAEAGAEAGEAEEE